MKFNFRIGAVVTFILDTTNHFDTTGKVISVDDNEVVILNQELVANYEYDAQWGCCNGDIDHEHTVSVGNPVHIDRNRIIAWSYYSVPDNKRATYYGIFRPSDLDKINSKFISEYSHGTCLGIGEPAE